MNECVRPDWFDPAMQRLLDRQSLDASFMSRIFRQLKSGQVDDVYASTFLIALRSKGESGSDLAAAAQVLRDEMTSIDPKGHAVVDTCGTGGDDSGTFNISTAAALLACAAGASVVKHGNRAVSSKTGSADVLKSLGFKIEAGLEWSQRCLDHHQFAFCYAPHVHPTLAAIARLRKKLGLRTIFNLVGPLANPAKAPFQVIGVGRAGMLDPIAEAIAILGTTQSVIVHGQDGLDEVTLSGPTDVRIVRGSTIRSDVWTPESFGLENAMISEIQARDTAESVSIIQKIFAGENGPATRFVMANAATALWVCGKVKTLREGVELAQSMMHRVNGLVMKLVGEDAHAA
jgi:anthranilate phosphoribosyltransferase